MAFSDLLQKMANGQTLTDAEKDELYLKARQIEQTEATVSSMIQPGTGNLRLVNIVVDSMKLENGDISMDDTGIYFRNAAGRLLFEGTTPNEYPMIINATTLDHLAIQNFVAGKYIIFQTKDINGNYFQITMNANDGQPVIRIDDSAAPLGGMMNIGDDVYITSKGSTGGSNSIRMNDTITHPTDPQYNFDMQFYMKDQKFVIVHSDGVTKRYYYLDLTVNSGTWVCTTVAP